MDTELRVLDSELRVLNSELRMLNTELHVLNSELRVLDSELRVLNLELRMLNLELRVLNTELRVLNRPKGRPSKKDGQRVSAYTPKAANKYRATVTTIGDLLYVEKSKCKKCGQYGHTLGTCQGKGYIGAIVDSMQAVIYNARLKEEASALKRKRE